jgi:hypothetical protein
MRCHRSEHPLKCRFARFSGSTSRDSGLQLDFARISQRSCGCRCTFQMLASNSSELHLLQNPLNRSDTNKSHHHDQSSNLFQLATRHFRPGRYFRLSTSRMPRASAGHQSARRFILAVAPCQRLRRDHRRQARCCRGRTTAADSGAATDFECWSARDFWPIIEKTVR